MTVEQFHKIRSEYGIYSFQIPTKEMLERITEEDLRETFSSFKKLIDKMKGKKQPFNNYHSKEEQELNLHNALTEYCDM